MMADDAVWGAMADAFDAAERIARARLMAALDGAEAAGGDVRGRQSAALLVVPGAGRGVAAAPTCASRTTPSRSSELRRAARRERGLRAGRARPTTLMGEGRHDEAAARYGAAAARAPPDNHELLFWAASAWRRAARWTTAWR